MSPRSDLAQSAPRRSSSGTTLRRPPAATAFVGSHNTVACFAAAFTLLLAPVAWIGPALAASPLLDSVKQNPALAKQMCSSFKQLNAEGKSATSKQSLAAVAAAQGLSTTDAEILVTYVIGLHCPDVR